MVTALVHGSIIYIPKKSNPNASNKSIPRNKLPDGTLIWVSPLKVTSFSKIRQLSPQNLKEIQTSILTYGFSPNSLISGVFLNEDDVHVHDGEHRITVLKELIKVRKALPENFVCLMVVRNPDMMGKKTAVNGNDLVFSSLIAFSSNELESIRENNQFIDSVFILHSIIVQYVMNTGSYSKSLKWKKVVDWINVYLPGHVQATSKFSQQYMFSVFTTLKSIWEIKNLNNDPNRAKISGYLPIDKRPMEALILCANRTRHLEKCFPAFSRPISEVEGCNPPLKISRAMFGVFCLRRDFGGKRPLKQKWDIISNDIVMDPFMKAFYFVCMVTIRNRCLEETEINSVAKRLFQDIPNYNWKIRNTNRIMSTQNYFEDDGPEWVGHTICRVFECWNALARLLNFENTEDMIKDYIIFEEPTCSFHALVEKNIYAPSKQQETLLHKVHAVKRKPDIPEVQDLLYREVSNKFLEQLMDCVSFFPLVIGSRPCKLEKFFSTTSIRKSPLRFESLPLMLQNIGIKARGLLKTGESKKKRKMRDDIQHETGTVETVRKLPKRTKSHRNEKQKTEFQCKEKDDFVNNSKKINNNHQKANEGMNRENQSKNDGIGSNNQLNNEYDEDSQLQERKLLRDLETIRLSKSTHQTIPLDQRIEGTSEKNSKVEKGEELFEDGDSPEIVYTNSSKSLNNEKDTLVLNSNTCDSQENEENPTTCVSRIDSTFSADEQRKKNSSKDFEPKKQDVCTEMKLLHKEMNNFVLYLQKYSDNENTDVSKFESTTQEFHGMASFFIINLDDQNLEDCIATHRDIDEAIKFLKPGGNALIITDRASDVHLIFSACKKLVKENTVIVQETPLVFIKRDLFSRKVSTKRTGTRNICHYGVRILKITEVGKKKAKGTHDLTNENQGYQDSSFDIRGNAIDYSLDNQRYSKTVRGSITGGPLGCLSLIQELIMRFTNDIDDLVVNFSNGSFLTGMACIQLPSTQRRRFLGCHLKKDERYDTLQNIYLKEFTKCVLSGNYNYDLTCGIYEKSQRMQKHLSLIPKISSYNIPEYLRNASTSALPKHMLVFLSSLWNEPEFLELVGKPVHEFPYEKQVLLANTSVNALLSTDASFFDVTVRESKISGAGLGVFAAGRIEKDTLVGWYHGVLLTMTDSEMEALSADFTEIDFPGLLGHKLTETTFRDYCLKANFKQLSDYPSSKKTSKYILPFPFCVASLVNDVGKYSFLDQCSDNSERNPNCRLILVQKDEEDVCPTDPRTYQLISNRVLNKGEEILYSYGRCYWNSKKN